MSSLPIYRIGTTQAGMVSLQSLGIEFPLATPVDYGTYLELGNSNLRGAGWLMCEWRWASIPLAQVTALQGYLGSCYVQTLDQAGTYGIYSGVMVQPVRPTPKVDLAIDYYVAFRSMVAVT